MVNITITTIVIIVSIITVVHFVTIKDNTAKHYKGHTLPCNNVTHHFAIVSLLTIQQIYLQGLHAAC